MVSLDLLHFANFNPRSREGSDATMEAMGGAETISIHAPARGATFISVIININFYISIHAPARGATRQQACRR